MWASRCLIAAECLVIVAFVLGWISARDLIVVTGTLAFVVAALELIRFWHLG